MKIAILGPGRMSRALAGHWVKAGHEILIAGRTPDRAEALASELGPSAQVAGFPEATAEGDAVLMGARGEGVEWTLDQAGRRTFDGKVVIDMGGPMARPHYLGDVPSMAEDLQALIPGGRVVKAFNLNRACTWAMEKIVFDGYPLSIPMAGDDPAAKEVVAELITSIGCTPIDFGGLERSRNLEAFAAVLVRLLLEGHDQFEVFNLLIRVPDWEGEPHPRIG
ncbi:NAD(P)-binding domain-containing protein [Nonomuraea wenchangensis]